MTARLKRRECASRRAMLFTYCETNTTRLPTAYITEYDFTYLRHTNGHPFMTYPLTRPIHHQPKQEFYDETDYHSDDAWKITGLYSTH